MKGNYFIFTVMVFFLSGCADRVPETPVGSKTKPTDLTIHSERKGVKDTGEVGFSTVIKKQVLPGFPAMTFGKALERYSHFSKVEWRETFIQNGKIYVDCIGWNDGKDLDIASIKQGVVKKGVEIKFVIIPDKPFSIGMVSRLEAKTDGKIYAYPLEGDSAVLSAIYDNKKLEF